MQLIESIILFIRIVFSFLFLITFIGFIWFSESRNFLENIIFIGLLIALFFSIVKSMKSSNKYLYVLINIMGFSGAMFFLYKTVFIYKTTSSIPYIFMDISFMLLIIFALSNRHDNYWTTRIHKSFWTLNPIFH